MTTSSFQISTNSSIEIKRTAIQDYIKEFLVSNPSLITGYSAYRSDIHPQLQAIPRGFLLIGMTMYSDRLIAQT
jgi:hypothetical protein